MTSAIVPVVPGRPPFVRLQHWDGSVAVLALSVRDRFHLRGREALRRQLVAAADRSASQRRYLSWLAEEARWYRAHGLRPPLAIGAKIRDRHARASAAARLASAIRRARYGASGYRSPEAQRRTGRKPAESCRRGHPILKLSGGRRCVECRREAARRRRARIDG